MALLSCQATKPPKSPYKTGEEKGGLGNLDLELAFSSRPLCNAQ